MNDYSHTHEETQDDGLQSFRRQKAQAIVARVLEQRERGQLISDSELLCANPDIHNELKEELKLGAQIRQASLWARRIGPLSDPLSPLTDSEVDQPIAAESSADDLWEDTINAKPRIPGYYILDNVSRGGQATIFRATQESTGRTVAVKVVAGGPFISSRHKKRFEREAKILATLDHPNIVSIIDRGRTADGSFYFVMPYVDGVALDEYWKNKITSGPDGTRCLVKLFSKIALALEVAHARGIVHRDVKPSNVCVDMRGEPHILDFGLARVSGEWTGMSAESITASGQIIGSLPWASPEQAAGLVAQMGIPSDIYSLGVVLFQSLTNEFPHSIECPIDQLLHRIRTAEPLPPSERKNARAGMDRILDGIVLHCLEKSPERRYQSARQLASDLEAWLSGRPVLARRRRPLGQRVLLPLALVVILSCAALIPILVGLKTAAPQSFELPYKTNSLGMRLVLIPRGSFIFGSPDAESERDPSERQQVVFVEHPFFIASTDVTQAQYEKIMHSIPANVRRRGPDFPVQCISEVDAIQFCHRLSEVEHQHYRLPTATEWEYACRANSLGPFGGAYDPMQIGWFRENSGGQIQPVGRKAPNAWGLFDMHGDVGQWCSDILSAKKIAGEVRGGSAMLPMDQCRSASRRVVDLNAHKIDIGFRVVCDI